MKVKPVSKPGHKPGTPVPVRKLHLANSIEAANEGTEVIDDTVFRSRLIHLLGEPDPKIIKATVYEPAKVKFVRPMPEPANKRERMSKYCDELDAWLGAFDTEKLNKLYCRLDREWYYIEKEKQSKASRRENGREEDDYIHKNRPKDWVPRDLPVGWYGQRVPQVKDLLNKAPLIAKKLDAIKQKQSEEVVAVVGTDPGTRLELSKLTSWLTRKHLFEPYYPSYGLKKFFYDNRVPTNSDKFCYEAALVHGTRYNSYKGATSRWEHYWLGRSESVDQQIEVRDPSDFENLIKFPDGEATRRCGKFLSQRMRIYKAEIKRYREGKSSIEHVQRMYLHLFDVKHKTVITSRIGVDKNKVLSLVQGEESRFIYQHSFAGEREIVQERNAKANPVAIPDPLDKKQYSRRDLLWRAHIARAESELRMTQVVKSELKKHTRKMEKLVNVITNRIDKHYKSDPLPQGFVFNGSIIVPI